MSDRNFEAQNTNKQLLRCRECGVIAITFVTDFATEGNWKCLNCGETDAQFMREMYWEEMREKHKDY